MASRKGAQPIRRRYRVVIHGIPDRDSADKLARAFGIVAEGSAWATEHGGTVEVEPDDVATAEAELAD